MSTETAFFTANTHDPTALTREQRLHLRDEIILARYTTGDTIQQLCNEYQLSSRRMYEIIQNAKTKLHEWFDDFPANGMIAIFRSNIFAIYKEIKELESLKQETKEIRDKIEISRAIINARIQLNKLVSEGPTYQKIKELLGDA